MKIMAKLQDEVDEGDYLDADTIRKWAEGVKAELA